MIDLDAKVRSLVENGASRGDIMRELDTIATAAERRAKRLPRTRRHRTQDERAIVERVGRLLFYLRHGTPAFDATNADRQLYDVLKKCLPGGDD
jgi:hypothetical protein